jgi:integrase
MLAATTGMRRSELAGLRRENLMLDKHLVVTGKDTRIVVDGKATDSDGKSEASGRIISIDEHTSDLLRDYVAMFDAERREFGDAYIEDDRLFCYPNGKAPHPDTITAMFNRLVDRAGAPRIRLHDVRHTYATLSLDNGIDLKVVSDRLGHANVYVTAQVYGHPSTGHDRKAAEKMASIIRGGRAANKPDEFGS